MNSDSTTYDALLAELERERARADSMEALSRVQAASLAGLARLAEELRCQVADLYDDALSSTPMRVQGLRNVTGRMDGLAETLSRAASGYSGARTTDMIYPTVGDDLRAHQWTPRPDRGLDGVLPPIPITELPDRRGYARGWHRGPQWITLWFTSPCTLAYADSSDHGRLTDADAIRAVITSSQPLSEDALSAWVEAWQKAHSVPFDASYVRVFAHLRASWGGPLDEHRCDERPRPRHPPTPTPCVHLANRVRQRPRPAQLPRALGPITPQHDPRRTPCLSTTPRPRHPVTSTRNSHGSRSSTPRPRRRSPDSQSASTVC